MDHSDGKGQKLEVLTSTQSYFNEVVTKASDKLRLETSPHVQSYLVELLNYYIASANLQINATLAETLLKAQQAERASRLEMLKRLGDTSLYISGFFGDSLRRKIVDIDYYADIGGVAYGSLAEEVSDDIPARVYKDISRRFLDYVDLLTYVSQIASVQSNQDLLRLYDRYISTGSELAREQLLEKGLLTSPSHKKVNNQ